MNLPQFFVILYARRLLLITTISVMVVAAGLYSVLAPNAYVAETTVVVNGGDVNTVTGIQGFQQFQPTQATFIATQSDIITSHAVAVNVVDTLKLANDATLQQAFRDDTHGAGAFRDWMAAQLLKHNIEVKQSADSNVIAIATKASDPVFAAALANAFADSFIRIGVKIKADAANRQAQWFDAQVGEQRAALQKAQEQLAEYQRSADVTDAQPDARMVDIETGRLNDLASQLVLAQAARSDADSRLRQMQQAQQRGNAGELSDISTNPVVQSIKTDLSRAEANMAQVNERFGNQHPQYLSAAAEVNKLQSRLNNEIDNALGGIRQAAEQAARREASINNALDTQKARILALKQKNDERDVLARDVESAKLAYQTSLQRTNQVSLESRLDQSTVAILSAATVPVLPASPKPVRNLALSMVLGILFAPGLALLLELKNRRIRSVMDLSELGLCTLSEVPRLTTATSRRLRRRVTALRVESQSRVLLTDQLPQANS